MTVLDHLMTSKGVHNNTYIDTMSSMIYDCNRELSTVLRPVLIFDISSGLAAQADILPRLRH